MAGSVFAIASNQKHAENIMIIIIKCISERHLYTKYFKLITDDEIDLI